MSTAITTGCGWQNLLGCLSAGYATGRLRAHQAVDSLLLATCWQIGCDLVEFEPGGKARAEHGKALPTKA